MAELKTYSKNGKVLPTMDEGDVSPADVKIKEQQNGAPSSEVLPPANREVEIKDGKKEKEAMKMTGVFELFRFSDGLDKFLMFIGTLCAAVNGSSMPVLIIIFGEMIEDFVNTGSYAEFIDDITDFLNVSNIPIDDAKEDKNRVNCTAVKSFYNGQKECPDDGIPEDEILDEMTTYAIYYCIIGAVVLVVAYGQVAFWMTAAERQAHRIRQACLFNILRQDIGWFDTHDPAELNTRLGDDVLKIQDGIGDKVGTFWQWSFCSLTGIIIGFVYGWKLTLVILGISPVLVVTAGLFSKLTAAASTKELEAYAQAGSVAEEVFGAIRTVVAFGGQEKEAERYKVNLSKAEAFGVRKGFANGASMGFIWFTIFSAYGLGFWYGGKLYREDSDYDVATVLIVFFTVLIAAFAVGSAAPSLQSMATARGAAYNIYGLIDRKSPIDSSSEDGLKPSSVDGTIKFVDVHFNYPARPDIKILDGLNLEAMPGQTVALVGSSGCGKSTTVQLLMRFYDVAKGQVLIDGHNIKELNVKWLRQHIGLVSQEPILFATTIAENIRYGRENVTMEEIETATKNANAYDFIMKLPDKFQTMVGERGAQLSGGQKQRLAIARALVRDPKILLLDEATSALDTESESIVQDALDKAREGRTTIVIAHRLSTIKTADIIIGFQKGKVAEMGTHEQLMEKQGIYYELVMNQQAASTDEDKEVETLADAEKLKLQRMQSAKELKRQLSVVSELQKEEEEELPSASFFKVMRLNSPEWPYILLGCIGSIINGAVQPGFAVIFSRILNVFSYTDEGKQRDEIMLYSLMFVGIGLLSFLTFFLQGYMFGRSGEALTTRIRDLTFRSMLRQEISFFDDIKNNVGALTTRLATDASLVQGVTGIRLGGLLMSISNLGTALIIAFVYGWQMAFVILGFLPFIALGGFMQVRLLAGQAGKNKEALEGAGKITVESIGNIRTVASLTKEVTFFNLYMDNLNVPYKSALKSAHVVGFMYAFSQSIIFFAYAASFVFGAYMIQEGEMEFDDVFLVFSAVVFGAMGVGNASAFAPDAGKAQISAARIFQIIESEPDIDYTKKEGKKLQTSYKAEITFNEVMFRYPNRKAVKVLQGLTFSVSPGQTLALVGSSGCGKSTSVQLIERFYDCEYGRVALDNQDIRDLNLQWLREQIGIVSQEPTLFDSSIAENIAYGDNTRTASMDEIMTAARGANIHSFIAALPDGYNTNVGAKGTQLSGGQKQRIAIARALLRKPKVLLLDEATSALDTESEKIVQEALDKARQGRTCVVIAHRLSTVQTADKICVVSHGKISESGTHSELMAKQGFYYKLVKKSVREL